MPWAQSRAGGRAGADLRPVLAFIFTQEPVVLRLAAERRKPNVTIRQLLVARIEEGVVKYQATFYYSILYSGVKSLRIDVPGRRGRRACTTPPPASSDKRLDPQPAGRGQGHGRLEPERRERAAGRGPDRAGLGEEARQARRGQGRRPSCVPRLVPRGVDRAWGQIVLAKAETLDFHETGRAQGLRPIDPQHDLTTEVPGGAAGLRVPGDAWTLPVTVTRYELEEVKRTSIDRAVVRMVLTPAGEIAVQALYRIRSARQRLAIEPARRRPSSTPIRSASTASRSRWRRAEEDAVLRAALRPTTADEPFLLELRYTVPAAAAWTARLPRRPGRAEGLPLRFRAADAGPAGQPAGRGPRSSAGALTARDHALDAVNKIDDQGSLAWVRGGSEGPAPRPTFHTDGTPYVFSTLRPPPDGSLAVGRSTTAR